MTGVRSILPFIAFLATACGHPSAGSPAAPEVAAMRQALFQAMEGSAAAWNRGDIAGHVGLYTDSAAMMGKNGPLRGRATIRGLLERGFWSGGRPSQQLSFSELEVTPLGPDHAMLTGKCTLSGGGKPDFTCRFTTIWERRPEGWRIIHDHSS
jgi:ketosteroid isomerase-like protein